MEACKVYGDCVDKGEVYRILETEKNKLIARMVLQHLKLDGLITPKQEKSWTWEQMWKNIEKRVRNKIDGLVFLTIFEGGDPNNIWNYRWLGGWPKEERIKEIIIAYTNEKIKEYREMIRRGELVKVNGQLMTKEAALRLEERRLKEKEMMEKVRKKMFIGTVGTLTTGLLGFFTGYCISGDFAISFFFGILSTILGMLLMAALLPS